MVVIGLGFSSSLPLFLSPMELLYVRLALLQGSWPVTQLAVGGRIWPSHAWIWPNLSLSPLISSALVGGQRPCVARHMSCLTTAGMATDAVVTVLVWPVTPILCLFLEARSAWGAN